MDTDKRYKIVRLHVDTHARLDKLHKYRRESFDEIICRLIDSFDTKVIVDRCYPDRHILHKDVSDRPVTYKMGTGNDIILNPDMDEGTVPVDLDTGLIDSNDTDNTQEYQATESEINNINGN